ncbi:hypothetical protein TH9_19090 [Thalassospira xiamenensis]|uniref:hypothetical protein n=1 Tax=Thalassospira xiamenensis TaxID=220697 RepID=UPI000DED4C03|nr:hypothetical protein [Thalassospira xiamenensis]RCK30990.1 hypothetical protein TH9_19090 [Thalassospira xiamenensis]
MTEKSIRVAVGDAENANQLTLPDICFGHQLYEEVEVNSENAKNIYLWNDRFDAYCPDCNKGTVYSLDKPITVSLTSIPRDIFVQFHCSRNKSHICKFVLQRKGGTVVKIGQFPSLADIQMGEVNKFKAILDKENSGEFYRALGLSAHDVGIAAFVYLRRVLERLVANRSERAIEDGAISQKEFDDARVADKIKMLKGYLPDILVENKKIYGVLSKGIHDLDEQECLKIFPAIRDLMFFILEEDLENREKAKRLEAAAAALAQM